MRSLSARTLREMKDLATLEYAVERGDMTVEAALAEARAIRLPEKQLDALQKKQQGELQFSFVAPPSAPARPLSKRRALDLCRMCSRKLGFPVRLDWASDSTRLEIDPKRATELVVPGGVARHEGVTADALVLMIAHEVGHRKLKTYSEPRADYWATRHGLRKVWPTGDATAFADRAIEAARATLQFVGRNTNEAFSMGAPIPQTVTVPLGSYPALQLRASIYKAGVSGLPMPKVMRETWR